MPKLKMADVKKDVALGHFPEVGVEWAGLEKGEKVAYCRKARITCVTSGTEVKVEFEGGGALVAPLSVLQPWHDSLADKRRLR